MLLIKNGRVLDPKSQFDKVCDVLVDGKKVVKIAEQIGDEGEVLLKNDGISPLTTDSKVTPFGYRYINPVMSGSGSGGTNTTADYVYTAEKGLTEAFGNVNRCHEKSRNG